MSTEPKKSMSPTDDGPIPIEGNFSQVIEVIMLGGRVARKVWPPESYVGMVDTLLKLHKDDGEFYDWIISQEDMDAEDWITLN